MPFNPSGVFERLYSWVTDRDNSINIDATRMDADTDGIVDGINAIVNQTQPFTGSVKAPAGTALTPAYSFSNDDNTGMYRAAENQIGFAVNGAVAVTLSDASFRFAGSPGAMIQQNKSVAPGFGTWSMDILSGFGTFQITPRDGSDGVISGAGGFQITRNVSGVVDALLQGNNVAGTAPTGASMITRTRGDARYALATSSRRFKTEITDAPIPEPGTIGPRRWVWGGELAADDPRRGRDGYGLIAEDVLAVLPAAVLRDAEGNVTGLDALVLIGALWGLVNDLRERVEDLEGGV